NQPLGCAKWAGRCYRQATADYCVDALYGYQIHLTLSKQKAYLLAWPFPATACSNTPTAHNWPAAPHPTMESPCCPKYANALLIARLVLSTNLSADNIQPQFRLESA